MIKQALISSVLSVVLAFSTVSTSYGAYLVNNPIQAEDMQLIEMLEPQIRAMTDSIMSTVQNAYEAAEQERIAAEKVAQEEAERLAAEEQARKEAEEQARIQEEQKQLAAKGGVLTKSKGVNYYNGVKETWYSTREPGQNVTAYPIPGRWVGDDGVIRDKDGFICVAKNGVPFGTEVPTSLGPGKVYDRGGMKNGAIDIYTTW